MEAPKPWLETDPVTERKRFITEWQTSELGVAELCPRHGISRTTGYKWIARYEQDGPDGLEDRSRRPHHDAH
jgi:putative transposase